MRQRTHFKRWQLGKRTGTTEGGRLRARHGYAAHRPLGRTATGEHDTARALGELSRGIGADFDESLRSILRFDAGVLRVERVSFWSLSADTSSIHCEAGYVATGQAYEGGSTLFASQAPEYFEAVREERALDIGNVQTDPRSRGLRDYCAARHISSMLDIPVWVDGHLAGVLCHENVGALRRWSIREEEFATGMSQFVSSALGARARTRVEAAAQRAAFLDRFSVELASLDRNEIQRRAVALSVPTLGEMSLLWIMTSEGTFDCVALGYVDPAKAPGALETARALGSEQDTIHRRAASQGQSLLIPEISAAAARRASGSDPQRAWIAKFGIRTAMAVPLMVGGKAFGAMSFFASDRKYDADDLTLGQNVVSRVAAALENARLYELAGEAMRARDDLLVLAAHELRTPLMVLELATRSLQRRAGASDRRLIENIARQSHRLRGLVDRVIAALCIRAEGVGLDHATCDLVSILEESVRRIAGRAEGAGSQVSVVSPPPIVGRWDRMRLKTVIDELLDNAVKFGSGHPITVSARVDGNVAEVTIRDEGLGIAADRLPAVFEPMERAAVKEHFAGLGLGLFIAKAIVDAHGGSITVASRPGRGSTFVVRLPMEAP
ncbi:MAG TPA: GAF domain-containing sensor histidine kinase [Polyangiaceae bacterium]|nr:GAF domain-containing sensor histidine kinase [Polyangiaceae bacterium]